MIAYEVTVDVGSKLAAAFEQYMREHHISDVFATGCFHSAVLARSSSGKYRGRGGALKPG